MCLASIDPSQSTQLKPPAPFQEPGGNLCWCIGNEINQVDPSQDYRSDTVFLGANPLLDYDNKIMNPASNPSPARAHSFHRNAALGDVSYPFLGKFWG